MLLALATESLTLGAAWLIVHIKSKEILCVHHLLCYYFPHWQKKKKKAEAAICT